MMLPSSVFLPRSFQGSKIQQTKRRYAGTEVRRFRQSSHGSQRVPLLQLHRKRFPNSSVTVPFTVISRSYVTCAGWAFMPVFAWVAVVKSRHPSRIVNGYFIRLIYSFTFQCMELASIIVMGVNDLHARFIRYFIFVSLNDYYVSSLDD